MPPTVPPIMFTSFHGERTGIVFSVPMLKPSPNISPSQMPTFDGKTSTDSEWIDKLDQLAKKHHILIGQLQSGKEIDAGEVLELPIEVRSWEGSLEALVRFMQELENTNEGMFNIRSLNFKPSSKKGYLRGSFTLTCA